MMRGRIVALVLVVALLSSVAGFVAGALANRERRDWWNLRQPIYLIEHRDGNDYAIAAIPAGSLVYSDSRSPKKPDKVGFTLWVPISFNEFRADPATLAPQERPGGSVFVGLPERFVPAAARPTLATVALQFPNR